MNKNVCQDKHHGGQWQLKATEIISYRWQTQSSKTLTNSRAVDRAWQHSWRIWSPRLLVLQTLVTEKQWQRQKNTMKPIPWLVPITLPTNPQLNKSPDMQSPAHQPHLKLGKAAAYLLICNINACFPNALKKEKLLVCFCYYSTHSLVKAQNGVLLWIHLQVFQVIWGQQKSLRKREVVHTDEEPDTRFMQLLQKPTGLRKVLTLNPLKVHSNA